MAEKINNEIGHETASELLNNFRKLDDDHAAHSVITAELFNSGDEGEKEVLRRIEEIMNEAVKNDARFRIAELYYQDQSKIGAAVKMAETISDSAEQTRCLVRIALAILREENNQDLAKEVIDKVKTDPRGYLDFYRNEKEKIISGQEPDDLIYTD